MKLLFTILIYGLIQLLPLNSANPVSPLTATEDLLESYENELKILAKDFCVNAKNLSEKLLLDNDIKEASLPEKQELKIFLQDFLRDYNHFERFKVYQPLFAIFINTAKRNNSKENTETDLKFQLLLKQYFANTLKEFEQNYMKFIHERFLNKIEDFKKQLSPRDIKRMRKFKELIDKLKVCQDFQCFPTNSDFLLDALNPNEDVIVKYLKKESNKFLTVMYINIYTRSKFILKDEHFLELSLATKQNLTRDINEYCINFENSSDIENFNMLVKDKLNFPKKYENNKELPLNDNVIFNEIIKKIYSNIDNTKFEIEKEPFMVYEILKIILLSFSVKNENLN